MSTATEPHSETVAPGTRPTVFRFWFRVVAGCALLLGLAFAQDPGFVVADTKYDLIGDPVDFLARSLHLWDAEGAFGQLQNQAYGYLWPMGSFFVLGWLAEIPAWAVQRLWQGLVLAVAFAGTARVSRELGVRSDLAALVAGFAFALSPRMISTIGPISIEAWPSAVAPWVLLALVRGSKTGSPRRAAAWAAVAVAMVGGVNAAATFAVIPLGVVWVLTRKPGPRRRALMLWWPLFTLLGTLWWLVPLFVMGAYSPPFLDFIETSSVTTFPTTLFDALRGTSNWVPYVDADSRAGNDLITSSYLALVSGAVLVFGLVGLLDRRTPHRAFLSIGLTVGMVMVTAGHTGSVHGFLAEPLAELLDGVLSPLRNVHKFDPVIRLPLVLGLAFVVDRALESWTHLRAAGTGPSAMARLNIAAFVGMVLAVVAGASLPALQGRLEPARATLEVPDYWAQTADWLAQNSEGGTALVVPGKPFADYLWGELQDEPLQHLADSRWAVRNVIPLTPPGNIRWLDGVEDRLAQGDGSAGLTAYLRRAGVEFLVVRNDLQRSTDTPDPVLVHQAIAQSPGLSLVTSFGPPVGGRAHLRAEGTRIVINGGWQAEYPAVEIYAVPGVSAAAASGPPPLVAGGPEDLVDLEDLGVLDGEPTVLAVDYEEDAPPPGAVVLTDGLRARERAFARVHDGVSPVLTPGDVRRSQNPARDYLLDDDDRWSTTGRLTGARAVSASSSTSDGATSGGAIRGELPYAALDGSPDTAWVSRSGEGRTWWELLLDRPRELRSITLVGGAEAAENQVVRVRTAAGVSETVDLGPGERRPVTLPVGDPVNAVRVEAASKSGNGRLTLAEVEIPGVQVTRTLVLPQLPADWGDPDTVVLRADRDARNGCVEVGFDVRCVEDRQRPEEEGTGMSRAFTLADYGQFEADITVAARAGTALDDLVLDGQLVDIAASSVAVSDARASAVSAIDGDRGTTWLASLNDEAPDLLLSWLKPRRIEALDLRLDHDAAARRPTQVRLSWPDGSRELRVPRKGFGRFPPVLTDQLRIEVVATAPVKDLRLDQEVRDVPVGVSEVRIRGGRFLPLDLSDEARELPCGSGPEVLVNQRSYRTSVFASQVQLARGEMVPARLCETTVSTRGSVLGPSDRTLFLRRGENLVEAWDSPASEVRSIVLRDTSSAAVSRPVAQLETESPSPVRRSVEPPSAATLLVLRENTNPGWDATRDGKRLDPVVVDGWQQGWWLDAGSGPVEARFTPDRVYRMGLGAGILGVGALVAVVLLTRRRWAGPVPPPAEERTPSVVALAGAGLVAMGLLAGWAGVLVAILGGGTAFLLRRRAPTEGPWLLAGTVLLAATAYAATPWGDPGGWAGTRAWPHYLVLVPLAALFVGERRRRESRRPRRRIAGRSRRR